MKGFMRFFMLSCLKATELIEKKLNSGLSSSENIKLHMHTSLCSACRNYEIQSREIDKAIKSSLKGNKDDVDMNDLKSKIINRLKED